MTDRVPRYGETLYSHWENASNYNKGWNKRAAVAVRLIESNKWICDVGCGQQEVRSLLSTQCIYLPADLKQWTPDTAFCELNQNILPYLYLRACDVCMLLGVIEYVWEPERLFRQLAKLCQIVIFSYNVVDLCPSGRHEIWVNAFSALDLHAMLRRTGFLVTRTEPLADGKQLLFQIENQNFGIIKRLQKKYAQHRLVKDKTLRVFTSAV